MIKHLKHNTFILSLKVQIYVTQKKTKVKGFTVNEKKNPCNLSSASKTEKTSSVFDSIDRWIAVLKQNK